ncbi:MAG: Ig-like domain-containing protein [Sandaracinaceae bacterium]|nr:Ig-like domain-containing protein [Sandaracinaceae bacterium]
MRTGPSIGILFVFLAMGCGRDGYSPATAVRPVFTLEALPMDFGAIPWPDDLYLDDDGHISVRSLPGAESGADPDYLAAEVASLRELDGFGLVSPVFFTFDGAVDPESLTATSVRLIDIDAASPSAFDDVPVELHYEAALKQLSVRPSNGHPLRPGGRYAAVLTSGIRDESGTALQASAEFAALRDATSAPADARAAAAFAQYDGALTQLSSHGVVRSDVIALAVFRTQTVLADLADAREVVRGGAGPVASVTDVVAGATELQERLGTQAVASVGFDSEGHVPYSNVGYMIHGTLPSPGFAMAEPLVHGQWTRDTSGDLVVKRTETVPFTLWLPIAADYADMRVILFQHGLGAQRGAALGIVDQAMQEGWAVIAIDAPFHGLRSQGAMPDYRNGFTDAATPDGFGDTEGQNIVVDFAGIGDEAGDLVPFHPFYLRDTLRQAVVDLMTTTRAIDDGDWAAVRSADAGLSTLTFADEPLAFIGISLGGIIGEEFVANEPSIGAALFSVSGGDITHIVSESAGYNSFFGILLPRIGVLPVDYVNYHTRFRPEIAIWQTLLDGGDAMSCMHTLRARDIPILMHMALDDESVPNRSTESAARALGAVMTGSAPRYADVATGSLPLTDNVMAGTMNVTRALVVFAPATHTFLYTQQSTHDYAHPVTQPFMAISPVAVTNPVEAAQAQTFHFFDTWRDSGRAEVAP